MKVRIDSKTIQYNPKYFWDDSLLSWDSEIVWDEGILNQKSNVKVAINNAVPRAKIKSNITKVKI